MLPALPLHSGHRVFVQRHVIGRWLQRDLQRAQLVQVALHLNILVRTWWRWWWRTIIMMVYVQFKGTKSAREASRVRRGLL